MTILIPMLVFLLLMTVSYAVISNRAGNNPMTLRFKTIENMITRRTDVEEVLGKPFSERVLLPISKGFEEQVNGVVPRNIREVIGKRLLRAGGVSGLSAEQFIVLNGVFMLGLMVANLFFAILLKFTMMKMLGGLFYAFVVGLVFPHIMISRKIAARQQSIQKDLPNALDLITVTVEAGLSFDGALAKLGEKMKGALVEEFSQVLQQMRMGVTRREALKSMGLRCANQDLSVLVTALVQADQLGVSIGSMLRTQAVSIRQNRRQYIEERATKAPVHMLFPLAFCIMPTLFIVVLGPAVLKITAQFFK